MIERLAITLLVAVAGSAQSDPGVSYRDYRFEMNGRFLPRDEFVETFSLAPPGKAFAVYSETRLKRAR